MSVTTKRAKPGVIPKDNPKKQKGIPLDLIKGYADKGLNQKEIAKLLDCSPQNVNERMLYWKEQFQHLDFFRANKRNLMDSVQYQILCSIDPSDFKRMALRDRITAYGILYDKSRIESGDDVVKIDIRMLHGDLEDIKRKKAEIISKLSSLTPHVEPEP